MWLYFKQISLLKKKVSILEKENEEIRKVYHGVLAGVVQEKLVENYYNKMLMNLLLRKRGIIEEGECGSSLG